MNNNFRWASYKFFCILAFILCIQGFSSPVCATYQSIEDYQIEKNVDQLLLLIQKRLSIMHEVARAKWNQKAPIEDKEREQQILATLVEQSRQYGLDGQFVAKFFQAQIDAAKAIQNMDFALWQSQEKGPFEQVFSLKDHLRLYIDEINQDMLALLGKIYETGSINSQMVLNRPLSTRESDRIEQKIWLIALSPLRNQK